MTDKQFYEKLNNLPEKDREFFERYIKSFDIIASNAGLDEDATWPRKKAYDRWLRIKDLVKYVIENDRSFDDFFSVYNIKKELRKLYMAADNVKDKMMILKEIMKITMPETMNEPPKRIKIDFE